METYKKERVRMELRLKISELIFKFKSKEEPSCKKLNKEDIIHVLSSMIAKRTQ